MNDLFVLFHTFFTIVRNRSTESDSDVDGRGGGGASHGTAADLEQAQGGIERSRFSPARIAEFKQLAADPQVYEKVSQLIVSCSSDSLSSQIVTTG